MRKRGGEIHTRCRPAKIEAGDGGVTLHTHLGQEISADHVMFATGRTPNTRDLGLESAGVRTGPRGGIIVDDRLKTSVPSIYALGDVTDRLMLTPVATMEGQCFAETLFGNKAAKPDYTSEIGRAHVRTPVTNAPLAGRLLHETKQ